MWRRYRCIYVLRESSIFLGGISLRLLRETKHGSGWALATAPPLCLFLQVWLSPQAHTRLLGAPSGCHRGAPGEGFPATEHSPGRCWLHSLPGGPAWAQPGGPFPPTASLGLRSQEPELLLPREGAGAPASPPSPVSPRRKEGSAGDSHGAAPPTAHRSDLGHQRISVDLPPSLLRPRREQKGSQGSVKKPVVKHKPRLHLREATNQCHKRARGGFTAASASSSTPAPCPPAPHGRRPESPRCSPRWPWSGDTPAGPSTPRWAEAAPKPPETLSIKPQDGASCWGR